MKIKATEEQVRNGLETIKSKGGTVSGNSVSVSGVKARYGYSDGILTVIIDDTPFLVSESYVESKIRDFFS